MVTPGSGLHDIQLVPGTKPRMTSAYRMNKVHLESLRSFLAKRLEEGIVRESNSPWMSQRFLSLNLEANGAQSLIPGRWPLPFIQDLPEKLHGVEIFSKFDAHSGFYQQAMNPDRMYLTVFITPLDLYEFKRLAIGLRNAPASFSRGMYITTKTLENILFYIDDCNLYSKWRIPGSGAGR